MRRGNRLTLTGQTWRTAVRFALAAAVCVTLVAASAGGSSLQTQEYEALAQLAAETALEREGFAMGWYDLGKAEETSGSQTDYLTECFANSAEWFGAAAESWGESATAYVYAADELESQLAYLQQSDDAARYWAGVVAAFLSQAKSSMDEAEALFRSAGFGSETELVFGSMSGLIEEVMRYEEQGTPEGHEMAAALLDELVTGEPGVNGLLFDLETGTYTCGGSIGGICLAANTANHASKAMKRAKVAIRRALLSEALSLLANPNLANPDDPGGPGNQLVALLRTAIDRANECDDADWRNLIQSAKGLLNAIPGLGNTARTIIGLKLAVLLKMGC